MLESFLLAFIPLFVAIDPVGTLPFYMSMTDGYQPQEKKKLALQAALTAMVIGLTFGAAGHMVFKVLGITSSDFRVAGGMLLLIFSVREIFGTSIKRADGQPSDQFIGVVPLGIPIIAGPAMITTLLILHDTHAILIIMLALLANLIIVHTLMSNSDKIIRVIGEIAPKVVAKVVAIFLAAIAVMMIRRGLEGFFAS
jgi:multiple antibiotic resistance protein